MLYLESVVYLCCSSIHVNFVIIIQGFCQSSKCSMAGYKLAMVILKDRAKAVITGLAQLQNAQLPDNGLFVIGGKFKVLITFNNNNS